MAAFAPHFGHCLALAHTLYDLFLTAYIAPGLVKTNFFTPEPLGLFSILAQHGVAGVGTFVLTLLPGCLSA